MAHKHTIANRSEAISPYLSSCHKPNFHSPSKFPPHFSTIIQIPKKTPSFSFLNTLPTSPPHQFLTSKHSTMAAMSSSVFTCHPAKSSSGMMLSSSDFTSKFVSIPTSSSSSQVVASSVHRSPLMIIKAQQSSDVVQEESQANGRRAAVLCLAAALFTTAASSSSFANAGIIDDYLEKSKANKELNDKKRLATSGANFARAFTVQFGTCKFPENFTGCQDLAKLKKVPFISEDLALECEGKDKYKCGSNVFWKW